jgi:hypothetical protein
MAVSIVLVLLPSQTKGRRTAMRVRDDIAREGVRGNGCAT